MGSTTLPDVKESPVLEQNSLWSSGPLLWLYLCWCENGAAFVSLGLCEGYSSTCGTACPRWDDTVTVRPLNGHSRRGCLTSTRRPCRRHTELLRTRRSPRPLPPGLIDILYPALLFTHCFYQWTFISLPPKVSILHPPTSTQQSNITACPWALRAARVASCSPPVSPHHHHQCLQTNRFFFSTAGHGVLCIWCASLSLRADKCEQSVEFKGKREWYWCKALFTMEITLTVCLSSSSSAGISSL